MAKGEDPIKDISHYFTVIAGFIILIGTSVFRNILKRKLANIANIGETFLSRKNSLQDRLNSIQKSIIFPKDGIYSGDLNDLDMNTLYILLQEFGDFKPHSNGWGKFPNDDDHCISANIDRIEFLRKTKLNRYANSDIAEVEFRRTYTILVHAMAGLGVNVQMLLDLLYLTNSKDTERMGSMQTTQFSRDNQSHMKENGCTSALNRDAIHYIQITYLTLDVGTIVLRDLIKQRYPFKVSHEDTSEPSKVTGEPKPRSYGDIFEHSKFILGPKLNYRSRMVLFPKQGKYKGHLSEFDIPALYSILRFACNIKPHRKGWGKHPDDDDRTLSANIERIRIMRNDVVHNSSGKIDKILYPSMLNNLKQALSELGANEKVLDAIMDSPAVTQSQLDHSKKPCHTSACSEKEWFFTLPIECDGYMVDCIIDNRLQQRYKTLEKIMKKKGLETLSGRPAGFCNQLFETEPANIQQFWRACKFHFDPIGRSPGVCNQFFETDQVAIRKFFYDSLDTSLQEIDCVVCNLLSDIEFEKLFFFHKKTECSDLNIENELYNSMESNCLNLCRFIFIKSKKSVITSLLRTVLDRAINMHCRDTVKVVAFRIIKEFFQEHKTVLDEETRMWIGTECECETTKIKGYEDCLCFSSKPKIIIERNQSKFLDSTIQKLFSGFSTKIIDLNEPQSTEGSIVANHILETSETQLIEGNIPGKIAKVLFKEHSNLSIIYPSSMRSKGFRTPEFHTLEKLDCINLVCKMKGVIPVGETHFPLEIEGVKTDVLEGTTNLLGSLRIGDVVESMNTRCFGTLGGFVKYYGLKAFLTCAHVVFGNEKVHSLTKEEIHHANCHMMSGINSSGLTECILIRHVFKNNNIDPSETSIDAALVVIKDSDIDMFNIAEDGQGCLTCSDLGLSTPYLNHNAIDPTTLREARAFCAVSGNQNINVTAVQNPRVLISTPAHFQCRNFTMFNQLCLRGMQFQPGDSGTCVYIHNPGYFNRPTGCIGMLIGKSTCGQFILTPMREILKVFDL